MLTRWTKEGNGLRFAGEMKRKAKAHEGHSFIIVCHWAVYATRSLGHQANPISFLDLDSQGDLNFTILLPQLLECLGSQAYARKIFKGATVWLVTWVEALAATPATQRVYVRGPEEAAPPLPAQGGQDGARCPPPPGSTVLSWLGMSWWLWVWTQLCGLTGLLC